VRLVVPNTKDDVNLLLSVLSVILAVVIPMIQARLESAPPSEEEIAVIIREALADAGLGDERTGDSSPEQNGSHGSSSFRAQ